MLVASIVSLVRSFQLEEERRNMVRLAMLEKEAVQEEIERLENMDSWKARILSTSEPVSPGDIPLLSGEYEVFVFL